MADGHLNVCKDCVKPAVRQNRAEKIGHYRAYDRGRGMLPHRVTARAAYAKTRAGKAAHARAVAKWRLANTLKRAAHRAVQYALATGRLTKRPCEVCGSSRVEAHHDDYEKPLEVRWFCSKHHHKHHSERKGSK